MEKTYMQLTQSELIQIFRKRAGLNQAELGSKAFNTNINSGRTKIKNIELGKQRVTGEDLKRIAQCLKVPLQQLQPSTEMKGRPATQSINGILISQKMLDLFPDLGEYFDMIEKACVINDIELITYLSDKLSEIFRAGPKFIKQSEKRNIKTA
jgi:transcriptional regulator with XRE-family HTH domain